MPNSQASQNFIFCRRTFLSAALSFVVVPHSKSAFLLPGVPYPRFRFGDRVVDHFWGEDPHDMTREIEFIERGTVVGLAWGKDFYYGDPAYQSWWYWVKWDNEPDQSLTELRTAEKELKPEAEFNLQASNKRA